MIYIKNNTEIQTIYINRNDEMPCGHHAGSSEYMDGYDDGFDDGYESGTTDQKNKLVATAFTYNSAYTRADGWSSVTVNVPQSGHTSEELQEWYDSGYTSGVTDGYDSGFTDGYDSGYTDGYNSGYTDGYNSGYTSGTTDGFNSGYTSGLTDGYSSGWTDGYASGFTDGYASGMTDGYQSGYTEGVEDGKDIQKRLLASTAFTYNGEYQRENGWSAITINVNQSGHTDQELFDMYESGYTSGYTDGVVSQKALLASTAFTENGHYERENGWDEVDVNVDTASTYQSGFTEGYNSGVTDTQHLMSSSAFTHNGTYLNTSGWSAISINVNQSGWTDEDLENAYNSGYTDGRNDGFAEGYGSGYTDGYSSGYSFGFSSGRTYQRSLLGTTAFTENGVYENVNGWSSVTVSCNTMGELYGIYAENAVFEINGRNVQFDGFDASILPLADLDIIVNGTSSSAYPYTDEQMKHLFLRGDESSFVFYTSARTSNGWAYSTTSSTISTKTFPNMHGVHQNGGTSFGAEVDNTSVSISDISRLVRQMDSIKIQGSSFYIRGININNDWCNYTPFVDSNGNACLAYNNTLVYPSSGNAYAVYRKLINGTYRYYIARTVA